MPQMFRGRTRRNKHGAAGEPAIEALVDSDDPTAFFVAVAAEQGASYWAAALPGGGTIGEYDSAAAALDAATDHLLAEGWTFDRAAAEAAARLEQQRRLAKRAPQNRTISGAVAVPAQKRGPGAE